MFGNAFIVRVGVLFLLQFWRLVDGKKYPPPCDSKIYCYGDLLHDVQMANLYPDSKTFVDLNLKFPPDEVYQKYETLRSSYDGTPPVDVIRDFVNQNFESGNELEEFTPPDFRERPSLVDRVNDPAFKDWVIALNQISRNLSRKVKDEVCVRPDLFSIICIPNGFVIPGGRFLEIYYWDSLFIIKGLLLCDMKTTVRGILENFAVIIDTYGYMLNGNRLYYTRRSQPSFFIMMCLIYFQATGDIGFIKQYLHIMEKEYKFWEDNRMISIYKYGIPYKLAHYFVQVTGPRPESYREDFTLAESFKTDEEKERIYINIKSAAESGLDFSSRWFIKNGTNKGNLSDIDTPNIIPVDLNAYLHKNLRILSYFNLLLGNINKNILYTNKAQNLLAGIEAILWDECSHMWFDYDLKNQKLRNYFYMTNLAPLWTESYSTWKKRFLTKWVLDYIRRTGVDQYRGGVPTSLEPTGQQWDFPNGWPPLECILVEGLLKLGTRAAYMEALKIANKWIQSNYIGFQKFQKMFEKYDVQKQGQTGTGGEYLAQVGFGWTNGVVHTFLDYFGRILKVEGPVADKG